MSKVETILEDQLSKFEEAVENSESLEIDGHVDKSFPEYVTHLNEMGEEDAIKIINHQLKNAVLLSFETIYLTDLRDLIKALETGETTNLINISRIVGYFSRINTSWNRSKLAELKDRSRGNYWEGQRKIEHETQSAMNNL